MRAYLIDPEAKTIAEVDYTGDYKNIYVHIGASTFDAVRIHENQDTVFVDDEGLLKGPTYFFWLKDFHSPLAGKGLVLGTNNDGDSVVPKLTLEEVKALIEFGEVMRTNLGVFWVPAYVAGQARPNPRPIR